MFTKIYNWFRYSSANPQDLSLTLKGFLPFLALLGLGTYTADATSAIDLFINLLVVSGQFVAGAISFIGLVRKIYNTSTR